MITEEFSNELEEIEREKKMTLVFLNEVVFFLHFSLFWVSSIKGTSIIVLIL